MNEVAVTIGTKTYRVMCGDGEEQHITALASLIDEKYGQLGEARGPQEAQNLLYAALFLADELIETRALAQQSSANVEHEKAKSGGKKAELRAEIETLRKAEARAREQTKALEAELAELRDTARKQEDLFADPDAKRATDEAKLADALEALADRAEAAASTLAAAPGET
ncbi:MAG: cell division protein ZapA [Pseudomonadota bacterium]